MNMQLEGKVYPPYRLRPDRALAAKMYSGQGLAGAPAEVPPTYLLYLRGETRGVNLFVDLDIPRDRALQAGQRYEWFAPIGWDDELEVTARIKKLTAKEKEELTELEKEYKSKRKLIQEKLIKFATRIPESLKHLFFGRAHWNRRPKYRTLEQAVDTTPVKHVPWD